MKHIVRLTAVLLLLGSVAIVVATLSCNAEAGVQRLHRKAHAARNACALDGCRVVGVLVKAGRITLVQTTTAFARALQPRSDVRSTAAEPASAPGR